MSLIEKDFGRSGSQLFLVFDTRELECSKQNVNHKPRKLPLGPLANVRGFDVFQIKISAVFLQFYQIILCPSEDYFIDFMAKCTAQIASVPDNLRHALPFDCLTEVDRLSCNRSFLTLHWHRFFDAIVSLTH